MSMTETGMTPADFGAIMGNRNNDDMFGGNSAWWIIVLFLFMWGRNGWGNGNGNGGAADGYVLATDFANLERKLDGINNGICDSTFALNNTINSNFRTLDGAVCNLGYQALQNTNAIQTQLAQCCCDTRAAIKDVGTQTVMNTGELSRQIERCCCDSEKQAMQTRFDAQAYNCNTLQAIDKLGDRIIDYMAADKAQVLRDENQALRLAASQSAQNQYIINALRPYPTPSFTVAPPYQFAGCGCGSF